MTTFEKEMQRIFGHDEVIAQMNKETEKMKEANPVVKSFLTAKTDKEKEDIIKRLDAILAR